MDLTYLLRINNGPDTLLEGRHCPQLIFAVDGYSEDFNRERNVV